MKINLKCWEPRLTTEVGMSITHNELTKHFILNKTEKKCEKYKWGKVAKHIIQQR